MYISKDIIYKGCILSSIAHAIMMNVYPDFSYEQSWDGNNFSINNSNGIRGTISFDKDVCVGAIRDDNARRQFGNNMIKKMLESFPEREREIAMNEALQYLLLEGDVGVEPCITSMFWVDSGEIRYTKDVAKNIKKDLSLLDNILLPFDLAIDKLINHYDMDSNSVLLLKQLYKMKVDYPTESIKINNNMAQMLPGDEITDECIESLEELNIFIEQR